MALIRYGPLVSEIRGSIGGTTFLRTIAGPTVRQRIKPVVTVSDRQGSIKASLSAMVQRWSLILLEPQRIAWRALAAITSLVNSLGDPFTPTGLQLYVRLNGFLQNISEVFIDDPPTQAIAEIPAATWSYVAGTGFQVSALGETSLTAGKLLISRSSGWPLGRFSFKGPFIRNNLKPFSDFASLPVTIWPAADLIASKTYSFRSRLWDSVTNGLSAPLFITAQTPATL